jgi:hypothetical protein
MSVILGAFPQARISGLHGDLRRFFFSQTHKKSADKTKTPAGKMKTPAGKMKTPAGKMKTPAGVGHAGVA